MKTNIETLCCNPSTQKARICCRNWTERRMNWSNAEDRSSIWTEDWPILPPHPHTATSLPWPTKMKNLRPISKRSKMQPFLQSWSRRRRSRNSTRPFIDMNLLKISSNFNTKNMRAWRGSLRSHSKRNRKRSMNSMKRLRDKGKTSLINWISSRNKQIKRNASRRVYSKRHKICKEIYRRAKWLFQNTSIKYRNWRIWSISKRLVSSTKKQRSTSKYRISRKT